MTNNDQQQPRTNQQIRVPQVRLILADGTSAGIVNTYEALRQAKEAGLDLVEVSPKAVPPVVKLLDYGRYRYEQSKKEKEARKNQKASETREIAFRPTTDEHDLAHKLAKAKEFLANGDRVRLICKFRGRETQHTDLGKEQLDKMLAELADLTSSYTPYSLEGKQLTTVVSPKQ